MTTHSPQADAPAPHDPLPFDPHAARLTPANRRLLALLLVSAFVVILNETTMAVALPPIMDDFGITPAQGQWLTTAFLLTMSVVIPTTGWLLGRLGIRRAFLLAMTTFSIGTALAALAPTFSLLLGARVVQASGTAVMMPLLMTTVISVVPIAIRGRVMGMVSLVIAAAPALGPTASGLVLQSLSWHWIFGLVLPIALLALVAGWLWVRGEAEGNHTPLDALSLPLVILGFGGLVYGLAGLGEAAQADPVVPVWLPIVVGALALVVFGLRQLALVRGTGPLLDIRVLTVRDFAIATAVMCIAMFSMFGVMLLLPLYAQNVLGLDPLGSGLVMLPGALAMGLLGPTVGRLCDRLGARPLVVPGLVLAGGALVLLAVGPQQVWLMAAAHILMSLGLALVFTPMFTVALGSLTGPLVPHGSAMIGTLQQLAGAAGTAAFVAIMVTREVAAIEGGASEVEALSQGTHLAFLIGGAIGMAAAGLALLLRRGVGSAAAAEPDRAAAAH
ncbi:DHA2 family efflux MFS transporter permease subunit [Serinibacter salmoneus]|uniref:DHA2 family lincomycin resistance protein-like MFS transporter n=1 Tax=Serinibacter salmoneus TaxID=556530 RepID=A0A2A9D3V2_9MICO|nr:DHA2 family efflux MFS transporter permease subunit [Serinibacter salmoneus]PFG20530.1 DHA2 family lincomycin resistance protein-like MFS transporter [Serinibacter salmoneus]